MGVKTDSYLSLNNVHWEKNQPFGDVEAQSNKQKTNSVIH